MYVTLPYLTFGVNSLLNRLLSAEAIFDVGPVRICTLH